MKLLYLLDTNICIYIAKQKPESVHRKLEKLSFGEVGMSIITYGELVYGAQKSQHTKKTIALLNELTGLIPPLPLTANTGEHYGEIRGKLAKKGTPIGNNDLWIAAHTLSLNVTLVTNNVKEFRRVPQLNIENWV